MGIFDVVHGEIVLAGQFPEPNLGGIHKWLVNATVLGKGNDAETRDLVQPCNEAIEKTRRER